MADEKTNEKTDATPLGDKLVDAAVEAAAEAKAVIIKHAATWPAENQPALVTMIGVEVLGSAIGAGVASRDPMVAKATLEQIDLWLPPIIEVLRKRVAEDQAEADRLAKAKAAKADKVEEPHGERDGE